MKIRNGFVSNSSSSSFLIAVKGDLRKELKKVYAVDPKHPLAPFAKAVVDFWCRKATNIMEADEHGITTYPEDYQREIELINKGFEVYTGSASSEGEGIELTICDMSIIYSSPTLIIEKEDGY